MPEWFTQNTEIIRTVTAIVTALVWVVYLQLLLSSLRRARRPNILISRGAGRGDRTARCLIGNMGAEPIFVTSVIADLRVDGVTRSVVVTDRDDFSPDEIESASEATSQGPIESGGYMDAGHFSDLVERAIGQVGLDAREADITGLDLTVIAATGAAGKIAAGRRRFNVGWRGGSRIYVPATVTTRQIASPWARRTLRRRLRAAIDEEAKLLEESRGGSGQFGRGDDREERPA